MISAKIQKNKLRDRGLTAAVWDREAAGYTNTIGASELAVVWRDPDFDPSEAAFYYTRVLEIPTPRWTDYDAAVFGGAVPAQVSEWVNQERAYSSPIWYTP